MATTSQGAASLAEVQSPSQLSSSFWSPSSLSSPSYPPSSCSSSLIAATHSVATFPSPSLCPESEAEQQLLVSAGLWSHYLHSISALTHAFRHWTQRTLASYKQLSQSTPIDSADLNATLAKLNLRYVDAHNATLALYTTHARGSTNPPALAQPTPPRTHQSTSPKPRVKAVRSLTSRPSSKSRRQHGRRSSRTSFSSASTGALRMWFRGHLRAPYPSDKEKARLSKASGMSVEQVANWYLHHHSPHHAQPTQQNSSTDCRLIEV